MKEEKLLVLPLMLIYLCFTSISTAFLTCSRLSMWVLYYINQHRYNLNILYYYIIFVMRTKTLRWEISLLPSIVWGAGVNIFFFEDYYQIIFFPARVCEAKEIRRSRTPKETAERSEDVENQRDFFFFGYFSFSLPRK